MMLPRMDKRTLAALNNLRFHEDFTIVREYLESALDGIRRQNDTATDVQLNWNQGACQVIQGLFDKQDRASEILNKMD